MYQIQVSLGPIYRHQYTTRRCSLLANGDLNVCADARDIVAVNPRGESIVSEGNIKESVWSSLLYLKRSSRGRYIVGGSDSFNYPVIKKLKRLGYRYL